MTNEEIFAGTTIASWKQAVDRLNQLTGALDENAMQQEVSPGRNRVYYIIGHLAAAHDRLLPLLGLGERLHPELDYPFFSKPDKSVPDVLTGADLRTIFTEINVKLTAAIEASPTPDWLKRHTAVSEADFAKQPFRNRLAVLQSRTSHAMFHAGQIRLTQ
jgi:hypothetical protein